MTAEISKPLILIVDDTPTNIQVLAENLIDEYRIKVAVSGEAALEAIERQGPPDL
ncbi:MAG: diguanylate cyclase response regulator, partial [Proteobacteria bacterium ST_bin11]